MTIEGLEDLIATAPMLDEAEAILDRQRPEYKEGYQGCDQPKVCGKKSELTLVVLKAN